MKFLLIVLKIYYVLDLELPPIPANLVPKPSKAMDEKKVFELEKKCMIHKEDETLCCGESSKKKGFRDSHNAKIGVIKKKFKKSVPSNWSFLCHVGGEIGHFARECNDRKSRTNEVNMVNTEIAEMMAHVHLDDGDDLVGMTVLSSIIGH
nr:copia-like retrotransposon [Tanacetum cinerariifolium]